MLPLPVYRIVARVLPGQASGRRAHHRALSALASGDDATAERWFEAAADRYRAELAVEPLARLRVHQLMARARATHRPGEEAAAMIEIVRRLNRLDRLEGLAAPHELADARSVLAEWIAQADAEPERAGGYLVPGMQAA